MDDVERAARREALDRMARRFAKTERKRAPVEAPLAVTNAYVSLIVACGFARLHDADRVAWFLASARAVLEPARDTVHGFLLDAYIARATDDRPALALLDARYAAIDRVARFKIGRLRGHSVLLQPARGVDAIGEFSHRVPTATSLIAPPANATCKSPRLAGAIAARDPVIELANLEACVDQIPAKLSRPELVDLLDDFAIAFARVPYQRAIAWTEQLASSWSTLTDAFGTNSHFCVIALAGADALVRGVVGDSIRADAATPQP